MWRIVKEGLNGIGVILVIVLLGLLFSGVLGCSTLNTQSAVTNAERVLQTAEYLKPLSDAVVAGICGDSISKGCVSYRVGSSSMGMLLNLAENALLRYKGDPSPVNQAELQEVVKQLLKDIKLLDAGYKGLIR